MNGRIDTKLLKQSGPTDIAISSEIITAIYRRTLSEW